MAITRAVSCSIATTLMDFVEQKVPATTQLETLIPWLPSATSAITGAMTLAREIWGNGNGIQHQLIL
jgi:hypothetical protein